MKRIAIVGSGIAGQMIAYHLLKRSSHFSIDWLSANAFAPACSFSSTSVVRKAGIEAGISPLGDLLLDSFNAFESFFNQNSILHHSIKKSVHYECCHLDSLKVDQFKTRYPYHDQGSFLATPNTIQSKEIAYIVEPTKLYEKIKSCFLSLPQNLINTNFYVDKMALESMKDKYDYIFIATGYQAREHLESIPIKNKVSGHYIKLANDFLPSCKRGIDWSASLDGVNFINRDKAGHLLISASNTNEELFLASVKETSKLYAKAKQLIPGWNWPRLTSDNLEIGVRAKGVKRMPCSFWETPQIAHINCLYKNGFSFAVKLASELSGDLTKKYS